MKIDDPVLFAELAQAVSDKERRDAQRIGFGWSMFYNAFMRSKGSKAMTADDFFSWTKDDENPENVESKLRNWLGAPDDV